MILAIVAIAIFGAVAICTLAEDTIAKHEDEDMR